MKSTISHWPDQRESFRLYDRICTDRKRGGSTIVSSPNIVLYFTDQQRWDTLGCYGQKLPVSPCLDALAEEGVLFEQAYTPQPVCGPFRAALQTGLYPTQTGCFCNNIALPLHQATLADYFSKAGYDTAYVGKWHLASDGGPEGRPVIDFQHSAVPPERRGGYRGFWRASDVLELADHVPAGRPNRIFTQISESRVGRCLRTPEYKYAVYAPGLHGARHMDSDLYYTDFLYDLKNDPDELMNLAEDPAYASVRSALAEELKKEMERAGERPCVMIP